MMRVCPSLGPYHRRAYHEYDVRAKNTSLRRRRTQCKINAYREYRNYCHQRDCSSHDEDLEGMP